MALSVVWNKERLQKMKKIIIFDWGRTLYNLETDTLFDGVPELLEKLSLCFTLVLVSLAVSETTEERRKKIDESGVAQYFTLILVGDENKDEMYERILSELNVTAQNTIVVDDQVIRGILWGNKKGATTVWVKWGKFADILPTDETGIPTYTVSDIREITPLLLPSQSV